MLTLSDRVFSNIKNKEALSFTQASAFWGKKIPSFYFLGYNHET